ncbi:unnamed protein product [Effrenium voratum]|nr:unnamed protein product [Effrenium voratum]
MVQRPSVSWSASPRMALAPLEAPPLMSPLWPILCRRSWSPTRARCKAERWCASLAATSGRTVRRILIQCIFGSKQSKALVVSDTELQCTSPPVDGAYRATGHLSSFNLETIPAPPAVKSTTSASNQRPMKQLTFYYRRFIPSISWVEPLSGPEFGNTLVSLRSDAPLLNSKNIKCVFGNIQVALFMVTQNEATCTSPPLNRPGMVELTLTADGQNRVQIGANGDAVRFTYYITPTVAKVTPSFGSSRGGTIVQLEGAHFINDGRLTCKFGDLTVPAFRFISSALVLCRTPIKAPGMVQVYLSNNGQNFTGGSDATFEFLGFTYFHLHPYLGPISGNTVVLVESASVPVAADASIRCRFGTLTVPGVRVNETFLQCVSPAVVTAGEVKFEVALNQQDFVEATQKFLYYENPRRS